MSRIIAITIYLFSIITITAQNVYTGNDVKYIDGEKALFAEGDSITVGISFSEKIVKNHSFYIMIANNASQSFNFNPEKIKVQYIKNGVESECGVYSKDEYLKKEKRQILWFGPSNVRNVTVSGESTLKDNSGFNVSKTETKVHTQVYTGEKDKAYEEAEERVNSQYFKKTTVFPNDQKVGMVVAKNPKVKNLIIKIPLNGNLYIFDLSKE